MKIRNLLTMSIVGISCLSFASMSASAASTDLISLTDAQKVEADAAIAAFCADIDSATTYSAAVQSDESPSPYGYRVDEAFRVYDVSYYDTNYGELAVQAVSLANLTPSYSYQIPYSNEDCCGVYTLREKDGELVFHSQTIEEGEIHNPFIKYKEQIRNTIDSYFDSDAILSVKYCKDSMLYISAVEIETETETYVIPYFEGVSADLYTGVTAGTLYTEEDFEYWASTVFEETSCVDEQGNKLIGGGALEFKGGTEIFESIPEKGLDVQPWVYVGISGAVLLAAGVFFRSQHGKRTANAVS